MIFPLFKKALQPIIGSFTSTFSKNSSKGSKNTHSTKRSDLEQGHHHFEEKSERKNRGPYSQYPVTNFTLSESEECIHNEGIRKDVAFELVEENTSKPSDSGSDEPVFDSNGNYVAAIGKKSVDMQRKGRRSSYFGTHPRDM
jgi:hypothetical protein